MSRYWEKTSMGMFGDKKGTLWRQVFKWPLICEAFNRHFVSNQTYCKLKGQFGNKQVEPFEEYHDLDPDYS